MADIAKKISRQPKGANRAMLAVSIVSVGWLVLCAYLGATAAHDVTCQSSFACLKANEWGDYLAGMFAPVAFAWLALAVWIQSSELQEQREELRLTRREFEYNRTVMEAQAEEMRKQATYIETQTNLLKADADRKELAVADGMMIANTERLFDFLHRNSEALKIERNGSMVLNFELEPQRGRHEGLVHLVGRITAELTEFERDRTRHKDGLMAKNPPQFREAYGLVLDCINASKTLSREQALRIKDIRLTQLKVVLNKLWTMVGNADRELPE